MAKDITGREIPPTDAANLPRSKWPRGMTEPGNIPLRSRPVVHNPDGSISTVRSMTFEDGNTSVVIPTVSDDGKILSSSEAISEYRKTGKHLGKFSTGGLTPWQFSDAYSQDLHNDYAKGAYGSNKNNGAQTTPFNTTISKDKNMPKNSILEKMKANNVPFTRKNYLYIAYLGNPPAELGAEEEAELPKELKDESKGEMTIEPLTKDQPAIKDLTKPAPHTESLVPPKKPGMPDAGIQKLANPNDEWRWDSGVAKPGDIDRPKQSDVIKT